MLSNIFKSLVGVSLLFSIQASEYNKDIKFSLKSGASVNLKLELFEEPVDTPFRLSLSLKCNGKSQKTLLDKYPVCDYKSYKISSKQDSIVLTILDYNPDNGRCDKQRKKKVEISKICK